MGFKLEDSKLKKNSKSSGNRSKFASWSAIKPSPLATGMGYATDSHDHGHGCGACGLSRLLVQSGALEGVALVSQTL